MFASNINCPKDIEGRWRVALPPVVLSPADDVAINCERDGVVSAPEMAATGFASGNTGVLHWPSVFNPHAST